jgi:uncharacterized OsmC-like protein
MPEVSVDWVGDWRFAGRDSSQMQVVIDGKQKVGAKPSDLLPLSLAACSASDLTQVLNEDGRTLRSLSVTARYTQEPEAPWAFQRIRLHYTVHADDVTEDDVADAIQRSEEQMCSVAASLRGNVEITSTFDLNPG